MAGRFEGRRRVGRKRGMYVWEESSIAGIIHAEIYECEEDGGEAADVASRFVPARL